MTERDFEKLLGIQTTQDEPNRMETSENHPYEPTDYEVLQLLANELDVKASDHFVDFGSGKGRVAIYMNYLLHVPATGIEYNALYVEVANMNRYLYSKKHGERAVSFRHMLAQNYRIQKQDSIFFFFNPFSPDIFKTVLQNIEASYVKHPRKMTVIVYFPMYEYIDLLDWSSFTFVKECLMPPSMIASPNDRLCIYEKK